MVTIKDVASRAGVAPSTVSYVLSGSRRISERTRLAVQQAITELGYHPSASARTLRSARTRVRARALPRGGPGYRSVDGRFAIEICDAARAHGYDVLMLTDREGVPGLRRIALGGQADGAILMAVTEDDPRAAALSELGLPYALLGTDPVAGADGPPGADLDWAAAAVLALGAAVRAGHRRTVYLPCARDEVAGRRGYALRGLAGARSAAERLRGVRVLDPPGEPEALYGELCALLAGDAAPTALVVQHVAALPTVLAAAASCGRRVPEELCVLPVGALPGELGGRRLPRIELPVGEMVAAVTGLAVAGIAARAADEPLPGGHRLIAPELLDADALRTSL
jgi:DNA-binding LacI/PurR family transcriptional regulator